MLIRDEQRIGSWIHVTLTYDKAFIDLMKASIPKTERRWVENPKGWEFTEKGYAMLKNLPNVKTFDEAMHEQVDASQYDLPVPYEGIDTSIDFEKFRRPATEFAPELYPYDFQKEGISRLVNMEAQGLYYECGLGKTYTSICAAKELLDRGEAKQVLIVSMVSMAINSWVDTLERMGYSYQVIDGPGKYRPTEFYLSTVDFVITLRTSCVSEKFTVYKTLEDMKLSTRKKSTPEKLRGKKSFVDIACKKEKLVLIADELHKLSNTQSPQFKNLLKIRESCIRGIGLTGTVIKSTPEKSLLPLKFEYPKYFSRKWDFENTFLIQEPGRFGLETIGYRNLDKLKEILYRAGMPALKRDYLSELPDLLPPKLVYCETDECSLDLIDLMRNQEFTGDIRSLDCTKVKDIYIRTHQALVCPSVFSNKYRAENRLQAVADALESLDGKTVIFVTLKPAILELYYFLTNLGYGCTCCSGDQSTEEIDRRVGKFVTDDTCTIMIATIQKMGTGFDGLKIAQNAIIYDFNTNSADLIQAIGRLHRNGQKNAVSQIYILQDNAISEYQYKKVMKQKELTESIENRAAATAETMDLREILALIKDSSSFMRKKK